MADDKLNRAGNGLLQAYLSLGDDGAIVGRQLKTVLHAEVRSKLIDELRDIDKKRIKLLNEIDNLSHGTLV